MSEEKPPNTLSARVAEALGCKPKLVKRYQNGSRPAEPFWCCTCEGYIHNCADVDGAPHGGGSIESYDTDWAALMPELVRLRIGLMPTVQIMSPPLPGTIWIAKEPVSEMWSDHPDPAHAACELILTLAANGKLPR